MNYSIVAEQVCKQFKDNLALDNVDLKVESDLSADLWAETAAAKPFL